MKRAIAVFLSVVLVILSAGALGTASAEKKTFNATVWVAESIADLTERQIKAFNETNTQGITFNATIESVSEGDAVVQMLTDLEAGADLYCFAQDQAARLEQAGALAPLGEAGSSFVTDNNAGSAVLAATSAEGICAYPVTADNGYFLYYDRRVISDEDAASLEKIIADCEGAEKYFAFEVQTSAWYLASFFFGAGCISEWQTDEEGAFVGVHDTFNSPQGLVAAKGIKELVDSPAHVSSSMGSEFENGAAAVVSGTWDYNTVKSILGDNMGVAALPSYTVDGKSYHLGSYNGCKLMGVKPQTDAEKTAALNLLAQYLTGETCQAERFEEVAWGPSNKAAQASDAVQANEALAALIAQNAYSIPQGQIHGAWWDIAKGIGSDVMEAQDEDGLKAALASYEDKLASLFRLDNSALLFVGSWNGWNNGDDSSTYYFSAKGDGTYTLTLTVPESDYMGGRIVNPGSWDTDKGFAQVMSGVELIVDLGADNPDNNIVFGEPGTYVITYNENGNTITIAAAGQRGGDANGDNVVDGRDAVHMMKGLLSGNLAELGEEADLNHDGVVDDKDLQILMNRLAGAEE